MKATTLLLGAVCAAMAACGDTYYWVGGAYRANEMADASVLANWSTAYTTNKSEATVPARLPTASDPLCAYRDLFLDLGGQTITVGECNAAQSGSAANPYDGVVWGEAGISWQFTNGTFSCTYLALRLRNNDTFRVWPGGNFVCRGTFIPGAGMGGDGIMKMHVMTNATFTAAVYKPYNGQLTNDVGGRVTLGKVGLNGSTAQDTNLIKNYGALDLPNGLLFDEGSNASGKLTVCQEAGTLTLGGSVSRNGKAAQLAFAWNGGTVKATNDVSFADVPFTVAAGATVTAEATAGATLNLDTAVFGAGVAVVKTGAGNVSFGTSTNAALTVKEGFLRYAASDAPLATPPKIEAAGGILFARSDLRMNALDADEGATFALDPDALLVGNRFLISTSDAVLARVQEGVDAWCAAKGVNLRAEKKDGALYVKAYSANVYDASSGKGLDDAASWGGTVPTGQAVDVKGVGVVDFTASSPAFASIRLYDGATLRVTGGSADARVTLPALQIIGDARLLFAEGAYAAVSNDLATSCKDGVLPVFEVATNANVYVHGTETKYEGKAYVSATDSCYYRNAIAFKNVHLKLFGRLETPIACVHYDDVPFPSRYVDLYFGTADMGETANFAFTGDGGAVALNDYSWNYGFARLHLACPTAGGRVHCAHPLVFRNVSFPIVGYPNSRNLSGFSAGVNNPTSETVVVEADNVAFTATDSSAVKGGVEFRFSNGGAFARRSFVQTHSVSLAVAESAKLSFADTAFAYGRTAYADEGLRFKPDVDGHEVLSMTNSFFCPWDVNGNGKGRATFADATWGVGVFLPTENNSSHPELCTYTRPPTPVFHALKEAVIPADTTFTLLGTNYTFGSGLSPKVFRLHWDRTIDFDPAVPIAGGGHVRISNNAPTNSMTATVRGGANTCTGTIAAEPGTRTTLRFMDGANWAGTVVANDCARLFATNALGAAAPAAASFGAIRFDGDFPIRVWKDGAAATNDFVTLAGAATGAGGFTGVPQAGYAPQDGDAFTIGVYPADAELPKARGRWMMKSAPRDADTVFLQLVRGWKGTALIVR